MGIIHAGRDLDTLPLCLEKVLKYSSSLSSTIFPKVGLIFHISPHSQSHISVLSWVSPTEPTQLWMPWRHRVSRCIQSSTKSKVLPSWEVLQEWSTGHDWAWLSPLPKSYTVIFWCCVGSLCFFIFTLFFFHSVSTKAFDMEKTSVSLRGNSEKGNSLTPTSQLTWKERYWKVNSCNRKER